MFRIAKTFTAEASHQLGGLPEGHKCARLHGHSYTVEVVLASQQVSSVGFVVDFADLTPVGVYLQTYMDHHHLNDLVDQPTSELLAAHLYWWCTEHLELPVGVYVEQVRVSETGKTWASFTPEASGG